MSRQSYTTAPHFSLQNLSYCTALGLCILLHNSLPKLMMLLTPSPWSGRTALSAHVLTGRCLRTGETGAHTRSGWWTETGGGVVAYGDMLNYPSGFQQ